MSHSPLTPEDDSIRTLLRRLEANPTIDDDDFRPDPLQVLREARMKVAARTRASDADPAGAVAGNEAVESSEMLLPSASRSGSEVSLLPPAGARPTAEADRNTIHKALIVVDADAVELPLPGAARRRRLLAAGAATAVCAAVTVALAVALPGGFELETLGHVSQSPTGEAETVIAKHTDSVPASPEGVARFTVAAVNFADVGSAAKLDARVAGATGQVQTQDEPVQVAKVTRLDVGPGGQLALPIELNPAKGTGEVAAIVLKGLPTDYSVVAAMPSGDGNWVLSPDALGTARIVVPQTATGDVRVTADMFNMSAQVVGSPQFILAVNPAIVTGKLGAEQAQAALARGRDRLRVGDVAEARSLFKLAAESGVAEGAFALGETFDPAHLGTGPAAGQAGDPVQAKFWYEYASQRGVAAARERLTVLNSGT